MLKQDEVTDRVLEVASEALAALSDDLVPPCHCDLFDDQVGASPGRIASFELDKHGKLTWWTWKSDDACGRAEYPLKLKIEFGERGWRRVFVRTNSWDLDRSSIVSRLG
jgi:hypothetical protein